MRNLKRIISSFLIITMIIPITVKADDDITLGLTANPNLTIGEKSDITDFEKGGVDINWTTSEPNGYLYTIFRNNKILKGNITYDESDHVIYDVDANDTANPDNPSIVGSPTYKRTSSGLLAKLNFEQNEDNGTTYSYQVKATPQQEVSYQFSGAIETFQAIANGTYEIEMYGGGSLSRDGGKTIANVHLTKGQQLYIGVGGNANTFNGGGDSGPVKIEYNGGGATHVATTNRDELKNYKNYVDEVLLVAGGAGSSGDHEDGFFGGNGGGGNQSGQDALYPNGFYGTDKSEYENAFTGGQNNSKQQYWKVKYGTGGTLENGGTQAGKFQFGTDNEQPKRYKSWYNPTVSPDWTAEYMGGNGDFGQGGNGVQSRLEKFWIDKDASSTLGYYRDYKAGAGGGGFYGGGGGCSKIVAGVDTNAGPVKKRGWKIVSGGGGGSGYIKEGITYDENLQATGVQHDCKGKTDTKNGCVHIKLISIDSGESYVAGSEVQSATVTTGIYSTYYRIDQNPDSTLTTANLNDFEPGYSGNVFYTVQQHDTYLHLSNVDKAGNISDTIHYKYGDLYKIDYNLNGGTEVKKNPTMYSNEDDDILLNKPEKEGYVFIGWTGSNGDEPQREMTIYTKTTSQDLTFTANWAKVMTTKLSIAGNHLYSKNAKTYYIKQSIPYTLSSTGYTLEEDKNSSPINDDFTVNINRLRIKRNSSEILKYKNLLSIDKTISTGMEELNNLSCISINNKDNTRADKKMTSNMILQIDEDNICIDAYPQAYIDNNIVKDHSPDFEEAKKLTITSDGLSPIISTQTDKKSYEVITITDKQSDDNLGSGVNQVKTKIYLVPRNYVFDKTTIDSEYNLLGEDSIFTQNSLITKKETINELIFDIAYDFTLKEVGEVIQRQKMDYIIITEDNVGNEAIYREHVDLDVGVDARITNVRNINTPAKSETFKSGETGYVIITFTGTPDKLIVEFPSTITKYRPDLAHIEVDIKNPLEPVKIYFTINKNAPETSGYKDIHVTALDTIDNKEAHDTVNFKVENRVKDEIYTRIRLNE